MYGLTKFCKQWQISKGTIATILSKIIQETAKSGGSSVISMKAQVHRKRCQGRYKHVVLRMAFVIFRIRVRFRVRTSDGFAVVVFNGGWFAAIYVKGKNGNMVLAVKTNRLRTCIFFCLLPRALQIQSKWAKKVSTHKRTRKNGRAGNCRWELFINLGAVESR